MRKARFTEEQIAYAMRQVEAGVPVAELCRRRSAERHIEHPARRRSCSMICYSTRAAR